MTLLTVKQLAAISGVTARTLHHYDDIGLLKPATIGANGYRYYGRTEQLRLQRILFHRELSVPLNAIAALLALEGGDQIGILEQHRRKLVAERERFWSLIQTIDLTIADLKGESPMKNADLYKGFSPEKQADYESWLIERHGEPLRQGIERSGRAFAGMSDSERAQLAREYAHVEQSLAAALRSGIDPAGEAVDALIKRHRAWVSAMWGAPCTAERYSALADGYLSHPDFVARYESIETGFARYLAHAIKIHVSRSG